MSKCMICAEPVSGDDDYHLKCLNHLFGSETVPELGYRIQDLNELAKKAIRQRVTVPGVQAKLSLEIERKSGEADKFIIVGLWGRYILKPPSNRWAELPENEHCTMMMAGVVGLETVPYGLIRLASGERAYITRRIDRGQEGEKYAMEDMCQLTGRLTEHKYRGSHEGIANVIREHTANPVFDLTRYFEVVLFSWLTGNSDMHHKNFSLFQDPNVGWRLAPAYDLLSTRLVIPQSRDPEDLALSVSGKRGNFKRKTFEAFGNHIGLNDRQIANIIGKFTDRLPGMRKAVERSFLSDEMKESYLEILDRSSERLQ